MSLWNFETYPKNKEKMLTLALEGRIESEHGFVAGRATADDAKQGLERALIFKSAKFWGLFEKSCFFRIKKIFLKIFYL